MQAYKLTVSAEMDLKEIARYTLRKWGKKQSLHYAKLLEEGFLRIVSRSAFSRTFSDKYPEVYVSQCENHYIFYIHPENKPPCIIAVLHERMDMLAWLKKRLN